MKLSVVDEEGILLPAHPLTVAAAWNRPLVPLGAGHASTLVGRKAWVVLCKLDDDRIAIIVCYEVCLVVVQDLVLLTIRLRRWVRKSAFFDLDHIRERIELTPEIFWTDVMRSLVFAGVPIRDRLLVFSMPF